MIVDVEVYLEHHGVKGMRWGIRRNPAKRLERLSVNSAITGYGLRGWAAGKVNKKYLRKNKLQKFETKDYEKLPPEKRKKYDAAVKRKAYSGTIGARLVEAALVGGAGAVALKKLNLDPKSKDLVKHGGIALGAMMGVIGGMQVKGIHDSYTMDKLRKQVHGN